MIYWEKNHALKKTRASDEKMLPFFQNYLNESLKYLDKSYPNTSLAGLHTPMVDTKPIYIDTKTLLGHHVDNNKNNTTSK